jgi:hypothetical protein
MLASANVASTVRALDSAWGGSGLLSGWRGFLFSHRCAGFIPIPGQVRGFPAEYATGCQSSTTTKLNVLLGKDLHLQARPDYCHDWGAKDAGDVEQSSLSRRLLRDGNGWVWVGCSKITPTPTPVKEIHTRTHHAKGWIFTPTPTPSGHPPGAGRPLGLTIQHSMYKYNGSKPNFHHNHSTSVHNQAE